MHSEDPTPARPGPAWPWAVAVVASGLLWTRTLGAPFVFDDLPGIVQNPHIEALRPLSRALDAPPGSGADGRPLVALSLALNHALGGRDVFGYHLFNIAVHLLAGVTLLGVLRRGLRLARPARDGSFLAGIAALLWVVHPLHTAALNHVVYRNVAMAGLAYLATVYAALRHFEAGARAWAVASVLACAIGTGCKETIVSAPLVVLLLDRALVSGSFATAWRARRGLYLGLAATWPLLAWIVSTGQRGDSVGFGLPGHSSLDYLRTQAGALVHYTRLAFWPDALSLDYQGWPIARTWSAALPAGVLVVAALALALFGLVRNHIAGILAVSAFLVLAPTSSFIPLSGAVVAEHRVYLALVPALLVAGLGLSALLSGTALGRRALIAVALVAVAALSVRTTRRNADFDSSIALWRATVAVRPDNPRAWNSLGVALAAAGRQEEARTAYARTLELDPAHAKAALNLGNLHLQQGRLDEARALYAEVARRDPRLADVRFYLGTIAAAQGREQDAVRAFGEALALDLPRSLEVPARTQLAFVLATARDDALRDGARALALAREARGAHAARGARAARGAHAARGLPGAAGGGAGPRVLDAEAAALAELGRFAEAHALASRAAAAARERGAAELALQIEARVQAYASSRAWRSSP